MVSELLLNDGIAETRVALMRDGRLDDLVVERRDRPSMVGQLFLGRVSRVLPGIDVAFVDIGTGRDGFLRAADAQYARAESEGHITQRGITRRVAEGEAIIVQIAADAYADKGPRLTTDISLPGRFVVYAPYRDMLSVSRRIDDESERERLQDVVDDAGDAADLDGGFIVRTAASSAEDSAIAADIERVGSVWHDVRARRGAGDAPLALCDPDDSLVAAVRDFAGPSVELIVVDTQDGYNRVKRYLDGAMPEFADRLVRHTAPRGLFGADLEGEIDEALTPTVALPSGGSLIIEPTTALTAVDVNSGSGSGSVTAEETNREAAAELARQLRIRNLSGTIVVDFIHMGDGRRIDGVIDTLRRSLRRDRAQFRIGQLSGFGLLELTRRRMRQSLAELLCETVGAGPKQRRAGAVAAEMLRRAEAEGTARADKTMKLTVTAEVAAVLEDTAMGFLDRLRERTGRVVELDLDQAATGEAYDVEVG